MSRNVVIRVAFLLTCSVLFTTIVHGENEPISQRRLQQGDGQGLRSLSSSQQDMMQKSGSSNSGGAMGGSNQGHASQMQQGSSGGGQNGGPSMDGGTQNRDMKSQGGSKQEPSGGLRGNGNVQSDGGSASNGYGSSGASQLQEPMQSGVESDGRNGIATSSMKNENPMISSESSNRMSDGGDGQSPIQNEPSPETAKQQRGDSAYGSVGGSGGMSRQGETGYGGTSKMNQQMDPDSTNEKGEPQSSRYEQAIGSIKYPERVEGYAVGGPGSSQIAKAGGYASQSGNSNSFSDGGPGYGQGYNMDSSATTPKHGKFNLPQEDADCQALHPKEMQVSPTWITSFPGSGSKMTWQSIEAITGIFTGDDMDSRGRVSKGTAVAIKTHYPSHTQENVFRQKKFDGISRGILVLRNPVLAIPGIFRFVYFVEQGNERKDKSEQPPRKAWLGWRNEYLESELKLWVDHAQFWLDNYKRENLHLLPFEYFVSPERGSDELQKLGNFLGSADPTIASSLLAPEKFCCVWEKLVNHEENDSQSSKIPTYTAEQLELMIQSLLKLRNRNKSFPEFFQLMDEYIGEIVVTKKSVIEKSKY